MQTEIRNLLDCHVVGSDGQSVGKVGQVYLNDRTGEPEWVTVRTGFFGMKQTFVPLTNARRSNEEIRVPFDKEMIKGAPNIDVDDRLSLEEEADLYRYYGMQPSSIPQQRAGEQRKSPIAGEATGRQAAGGRAEDTRRAVPGDRRVDPAMSGRDRDMGQSDRDFDMTRSEEQLHIGKERRETGRVRLHKYVDTENVSQRVPVMHEEVVIEREVIRDGETGGVYEIHEEERDIRLYEEHPVVGKETKPVERIHVHKESVQGEETVQGQVRKERLEIDEEGSGKKGSSKPEDELRRRRDKDFPGDR
ncbi:DUF2382 domain-containing protein [Nonomuraea sp. NPDC002799]